MPYDGYRHGRERALSALHSSFRIRGRGYEGILNDLRIAEDMLRFEAALSSEFRAGVESVVRECRTAVCSYERD